LTRDSNDKARGGETVQAQGIPTESNGVGEGQTGRESGRSSKGKGLVALPKKFLALMWAARKGVTKRRDQGSGGLGLSGTKLRQLAFIKNGKRGGGGVRRRSTDLIGERV